ncbi:DUF2760 domain-containing protein [Alkalimarinus alittae]|uniref:DUF2760 domain-containing protein n=1 Tax=Alkalimarinus alittae TaxID=2961619 RepID=A0ABY6N2K4_9ALTE|nr:DUF2760 domain-containing protein [Alkalimarinus alittae]UZE96328.1 DUF2760 domain-containing protein [Alkalimarinus alittae]
MNINLTAAPTTFDMLHLGLAILAVLFFVLFLVKPRSTSHVVTNENTAAAPEAVKPVAEKPAVEKAKPAQLKEATPDAALQLLTLLQQEARFIDFTQEDLAGYSDADIGAAARVVHEGSKKALETYFTFAAVRSEDEETRITLPVGFNASEVRLTGNVVGEAPFTGSLIHKGWKVTDIRLPKLAEGHDTSIVAPAEVEL